MNTLQDAEMLFNRFIDEAVIDLPDGGVTCDINAGIRLISGSEKAAQIAMQFIWKRSLEESDKSLAQSIQFAIASMGVCLAMCSDRTKFLAFLDTIDVPTCAPGIKSRVLLAIRDVSDNSRVA